MAGKSSVLTINIGCVRVWTKQIKGKTQSHSCGSSNGPDITSEVEGQNSSLSLSYNCGVAGYQDCPCVHT